MRPISRRARNSRREPSALDKYDPYGIWQSIVDRETGKLLHYFTPYGLLEEKAAFRIRLMECLSAEAQALLGEYDTATAFKNAPSEAIQMEIAAFADCYKKGVAALAEKYQKMQDAWDRKHAVGNNGGPDRAGH